MSKPSKPHIVVTQDGVSYVDGDVFANISAFRYPVSACIHGVHGEYSIERITSEALAAFCHMGGQGGSKEAIEWFEDHYLQQVRQVSTAKQNWAVVVGPGSARAIALYTLSCNPSRERIAELSGFLETVRKLAEPNRALPEFHEELIKTREALIAVCFERIMLKDDLATTVAAVKHLEKSL